MSKISERIRYIGVNDGEKSLFEGIWPLPFGISYNSYIIVDKKIALIDTIDEGFEREYLEKIKEEIGSRAIDYLVVNHMEPDHSSLISLILDIYPGILVVADAKALPMLKGYYGLGEDDVLVVRDGDKLNLGSCELTFHMTPMVHWPETMMTWLGAEKTLFSGDAFGTFGSLKDGITDSEYRCGCGDDCDCDDGHGCDCQEFNEKGECMHYCSEGFRNGEADAFGMYRNEMIRYYSNIVGKYGGAVHGSMYGNTAEAARNLERELMALGIPVALHNLNVENCSAALRDTFRYSTLAVGSPTYNGAIFPPVEAFMHALSSRMIKGRGFFAFGSYTWAAASVRLLNDYASTHGFSLLHPGISFPQAYSPDKCDMKEIARIISGNI